MHVVTYNIQFCTGRDGRVDVERIADAVRDADLIALQEVDVHWDRSGDVSQPEALAAQLPEHAWAYHAVTDVAKRGAPARRRQFGNLVLSRYPLLAVRRQALPRAAYLDFQSQPHGVLEAWVDAPGGPVRLYCTHLDFVSAATRRAQLEAILALERDARAHGAPVTGKPIPHPLWEESMPLPDAPPALICGDLNLTPDSDEYRLLTGERDLFRGLPLTRRDGFADAWLRAGDGSDGFTAHDPRRDLGLRLDYCLLSAELVPRLERARVDADAAGSDHQPLHVWLRDTP